MEKITTRAMVKLQNSPVSVFERLDKMLKSNEDWEDSSLDELIEGIDRVLSQEKENIETKSENTKPDCKEKSKILGKWGKAIKSAGKKISQFCGNNIKIAVDVLETIGECHWAAAGFVVVAAVLEKFDTVKRNRKECVMLLKSMNDLSKVVLELRPLPHKTANTQATIKESIHTILKGAMSCSKMMETGITKGALHSEDNKEELLDVRREIEELRSAVHIQISVCIFKWLCENGKESGGRKRSVTNAELENEEDSNKRSRISDDRDLNKSSNPPQILRKNSRMSDFYPSRKHEDRDLNESSNPTQVPRTTERKGRWYQKMKQKLKNVGSTGHLH